MKKLFVSLAISIILFFSLAFVALAQEPEDSWCVTINGTLVETDTVELGFDTYSGYFTINTLAEHNTITNGDGESIPSCTSSNIGYWDTWLNSVDCEHAGDSHALSAKTTQIAVYSPISGTRTHIEAYDSGVTGFTGAYFYCQNGGAYDNLGNAGATGFYMDNDVSCDGFAILNARMNDPHIHTGITVECGTGDYEIPELYTCPTVEEFHFTGTITDAWELSAGATITDSILTLPPDESASQDLSLTPSSGYNAVISVTNVVTPASLDVYLAGLQNVVLTGTGLYTVPFTTTTALSQTYQLVNHPESTGNVEIDYTCLYPTTITETAIVCLAPTNGEFDTADNWDWYYDARWNESGLNAYLPYNDTVTDTGKSLVVSSGSYSLPTLITDTYLILGFESMALGQSGVVATRVGDNWQEFDVNSSLYRFEADISSQAGLTLTTVSFSNSGAPGGEYAAVDDLTVDNVCIYVSDTPPNIPTPTNPWLSPFDFGFNFTCADVPALLAGYGIDVYTPAAVYQSGVITWTEEYWVPWLAGAVWNNAGAPISCFLVEFMRLVVGIAEQFINNYTNVINWNYETQIAGVPWFQEGMAQPSNYLGKWLTWYSNSFRAKFYSSELNVKANTNWTQSGFIETQNTMSNNTLDVGDETGSVISTIMDQLMIMWNASVIPWMNYTSAASNTANIDESTSESLLDLFGWLTDAITGLLNLIWSVLSWLAGLFSMAGDIPVEVYHSVNDGISSTAFELEVMCVDSNFWCYFWAGVYLVNETISQTIGYPIIIAGLILVTLVVIWRNLSAMFTIEIG